MFDMSSRETRVHIVILSMCTAAEMRLSIYMLGPVGNVVRKKNSDMPLRCSYAQIPRWDLINSGT